MALEVGPILVHAIIDNFADIQEYKEGIIDESMIRRVEIPDAVVDPEFFGLLIPSNFVEELGLEPLRAPWATRPPETLGRLGIGPSIPHWPVVLTVCGRECTIEVGAIPDHFPVYIGSIPLHALGLRLDDDRRGLVDDPDPLGEKIIDVD